MICRVLPIGQSGECPRSASAVSLLSTIDHATDIREVLVCEALDISDIRLVAGLNLHDVSASTRHGTNVSSTLIFLDWNSDMNQIAARSDRSNDPLNVVTGHEEADISHLARYLHD